ncbi:MAG: (E)-4-hydroxy-3-methylbut-2-enyl-diphosphate synthase [Alloprevotella sp.]|nr:(E)-4-hydroxy-3-methylbut-2-enyl-diphosphate synthase [Alloprevotella sp.]
MLENNSRRTTHEVNVGGVPLGGNHPVRLQSMTTTDTNDVAGSVAQCLRIAEAGADYVRLTTQGLREVESLVKIRAELRRQGCNVPLVADVHFNPAVADAAAAVCEKVRINPGNYVDPARKFKHIDYTEAEYAAELQRLDERFCQLLSICKQHQTALRIGVNHGSLSDRIMSRYGDTPDGIAESCMEFLRVAVREGFKDIVCSIKASNTVVMVQSVRLLAAAMQREGMTFPLHLGVTEAGEGEDGRIKSAVGIGALLCEGIGDTIRVSLSEPPEDEIPVAGLLRDMTPRARQLAHDVATSIENGVATLRFEESDWPSAQLLAAMAVGGLLIDKRATDLRLFNEAFPEAQLSDLADRILQAARVRFTRTEYISCPGCGRTLYDLPATIARIKAATAHLVGLKIGIMGCIVNGPGEMADADYGYVGAARGKVSLYRGKECVEKNIPEEEAVQRLLDLIERDKGAAADQAPLSPPAPLSPKGERGVDTTNVC